MGTAANTGSRTETEHFDSFFASLGQGVNAYLERLSRRDEVQRLQAMNDAQLRQMGLHRDEIVRHVFRDVFAL